MDLNGMQMYRTQFINMVKQAGNDSLYLTVYNLEPDIRRINITVKISLQ